MKHTVQIRWGVVLEGEEPNEQTYSFGSRAELNAFMQGVEEADGWCHKEVLHDSREASPAPEDIQIVCRTCGTENVLRDAYANWDPIEQEWVLLSVYDDAVCEGRCGGETKLDEVNLIEWLKLQGRTPTDA